MQSQLIRFLKLSVTSIMLGSCFSEGPDKKAITTGQCFDKSSFNLQSTEIYAKEILKLNKSGCNHPDLLKELGEMYLSDSEFQLATELFTKVLKSESDAQISLLRGRALYELGEYWAAISDYKDFLNSVGDLKAHYARLSEQSPFVELTDEDHFKSVSDGEIVEALNNSGYAELFLGEFENAIDFFQTLYELEDGSIIAELGLAQSYFYWGCESCQVTAFGFASKIIDLPGGKELYGEYINPILEAQHLEPHK